MIEMIKLNPTNTRINVDDQVSDPSIVTIHVEYKGKDTPGRISLEASRDIPPDSIDEVVTALYDARRITKGTLTVL